MCCISCLTGRGQSTFFFFNDTATTEIYTLSLHDALPISIANMKMPVNSVLTKTNRIQFSPDELAQISSNMKTPLPLDRKSTRLNSSHSQISYAVFCLKKKK